MTQETAFQSAWKIVETEAHVIFAKVVVLPQVWALTGGLRKYTGCILNTKKKKKLAWLCISDAVVGCHRLDTISIFFTIKRSLLE